MTQREMIAQCPEGMTDTYLDGVLINRTYGNSWEHEVAVRREPSLAGATKTARIVAGSGKTVIAYVTKPS